MLTSPVFGLKNETIMGGEIKLGKAADITERNTLIKKLNNQILKGQNMIDKATVKVINAATTLIG